MIPDSIGPSLACMLLADVHEFLATVVFAEEHGKTGTRVFSVAFAGPADDVGVRVGSLEEGVVEVEV